MTYTRYPVEGTSTTVTSVVDTNSIDLTLAAHVLSADLRLSSNAADANNLIVSNDIESTGVVGLRSQITYSSIRGLFSATAPITLSAGGVIAMPVATSLANGYLSSADWSTFNSKQAALTIGNLTDVGTDGIVVTGGTGSVIGSGVSLAQHVADSTHNGYLSSTDWSTFNGKQASGNYITALTGDVTASGPGSVAATLATVNSNVGSFGSATTSGTFTVNAKGLITAASSTTIAIPFSAVSGTVPLNQGGTGQTTKAPAFDALSPMTTGGDIIYGGASGTGTRLANGSSGQFLKSNGTTTAPSWATPTPAFNYTAQTANYSAVAGDVVNCTSGSFTVTLPTAASIAGQQITITNSGGGVITIATTSAQTIGSFASAVLKMGTVNDCITVYSDGANWQIKDVKITCGARYTGSSTALTTVTITKVVWNTSSYDPLSLMSSGNFTAPWTGKYQVNSTVNIGGTFTVDQQNNIYIYVDGSPVAEAQTTPGSSMTQVGLTIADCVSAATGKIIDIRVRPQCTSPTITNDVRAFVSIIWIGN